MQNETETTNKKDRAKSFGRIFESPFFWGFFFLLAFGVPLYRSLIRPAPAVLPVLAKLPDFSLRDQDDQPVNLEKLRGSVLIVNFIYTSCPDTCPLLTQQMRKIQDRVKSAEQEIRLISISVDPKTDSPAALKKFSEPYRPHYRQWSFLTGDLIEVQKVVVDGFKIGLDRGAAPAAHTASKMTESEAMSQMLEITHGEHFVIVDQIGQIRAYQRANNESDINELVRKVAVLVNTRPLAAAPATVAR